MGVSELIKILGKEINKIAKKHGKELNIRVGLRTGDTTSTEKTKNSATLFFIAALVLLIITLFICFSNLQTDKVAEVVCKK